ncbi:MAG TPA: phosphosulfolactate synthase [Bacillota bacterium]|nr:phosphosulfolactate synthase [Bacillota bacterium]
MAMNVWEGILEPPAGARSGKPRSQGWTMVMDKGLTLPETAGWLELVAPYIDLVKLTFGTSALYPADYLVQKVQLIRRCGVSVCPGGTLLEIAVYQGKIRQFLARAGEIGFDFIEISDGTLPMSPSTRHRVLDLCKEKEFRVISEVGKKDPLTPEKDPLEEIRADLEHGAEKVIIEARESGKGVGIYDEQGKIRTQRLDRISEAAPIAKILWEAPIKSQQAELINRFGPDVNLGNIAPQEIISLEALRLGLRADTLKNSLNPARRATVTI